MDEVAPSMPTDVGHIIGPVILGQVATVLLFGILLDIALHFPHSHAWKRAGWPLCLSILLVVTLCCGSVALAIHDLWHLGTTVASEVKAVVAGTMPMVIQPIFTGVIAVTVQLVLGLRVAKVINSRLVRYIFLFLNTSGSVVMLYGTAGYTAWGVLWVQDNSIDYTKNLGGLSWIGFALVWLWTAAGIGFLVSLAYIYANYKQRAATTVSKDSVLRLLFVVSIRSAVFTPLFALVAATLVVALGFDDYNTYLTPYALFEPLPVLYALSLFTTLPVLDPGPRRLSDFSSNKAVHKGCGPSQLPDFVIPSSIPPSLENGNGSGRRSSDLSGGAELDGRATNASDAYSAEHGLNVIRSGKTITSQASFFNDERGGSRLFDGRGIMVQVEKEQKVERDEGDEAPRKRVLLI